MTPSVRLSPSSLHPPCPHVSLTAIFLEKKKIYQTQERGKYELDAQYSEAAEVELPFVVEQQESLPTSI
jgi:hypothetical protein